MDDRELIKMRDTFRKCADIIDELFELKEKEDNGEDVKKELESVVGKFTIAVSKLSSLQ